MYANIRAEMPKLKAFPPIDAERRIREINDLFSAYIFVRYRKNKEFEYWTSCCNRHEHFDLPMRTVMNEHMRIMYSIHNHKDTCPFCGRKVTYKFHQHLGTKKSLREFHPVIILTEAGGDIYARAYWCMKDYVILDALPTVYSPAVYCFSAKRHFASMVCQPEEKDSWVITQEGSYKNKSEGIHEPFTEGGWCMKSYVPYYVLGLEEIEKSDFKYCCTDEYYVMYDAAYRHINKRKQLMRFLTIAAIYPEKVEMLIKRSLGRVVNDLVEYSRKNYTWFDWDSTDPRKMFKLSKPDMKKIIEHGTPLRVVREYASLKKYGLSLEQAHRCFGYAYSLRDFQKHIRDFSLPFDVAFKYAVHQEAKTKSHFNRVMIEWRDYLTMAQKLGWDLSERTVLMPPRLHERHEQATAEINARAARERAERDKQRHKEFAERAMALRKKYNIEAGGYFIRIAETAEEVQREGQALSHCVGGYAERHMSGATTILFLRRMDAPSVSLYTIQMTGNRLIQIHGYKNEVGTGERPPRETMDWLLTPWLKWIEAGSPRDKKGKPRIKINKPMEVKTA